MKILKKNILKLKANNIIHCYKLISNEYNLNKIKNLNGWSQKSISNYIHNPKYISLGYFQKKKLCAFIISNYIKINDIFENEILLICVEKKFRRKGIGTALISYIINQKKYFNLSNIYLEFSAKNRKAKSFYENCGFKYISLRKKYYTLNNNKKEDALLYNLEKRT